MPGIGRPIARARPCERTSADTSFSSRARLFTPERSTRRTSSERPRIACSSWLAGSTAAKARPVAVPRIDITVPARMLTCSGWLPSINRTTVGPKLAHTAITTVWSILRASASATGVAALIGSDWCRQLKPICKAIGPSA